MGDFRSQIKNIRRKTKLLLSLPVVIPCNLWFAFRHRRLRREKKIIYALTPPSRLKNIGDHAQALAVHRWLRNHYQGIPVLEMDKDRARYFLPALRWLIRPVDLILLHSGGNLGDRGMWSESIRRLLIGTFHGNRIVSLPQTIYFSDTPRGKREYENTCRIYNRHPALTVIGRDPRSGDIARKMFPQAQAFSMPDFVLSLPPYQPAPHNDPPRILLCLRGDDESVITPDMRAAFLDTLPYEYETFDTTLAEPIGIADRERILSRTLDYFYSFDIVITDRYHGVIFSVLCRKPCLVLRTVDHKLTSALAWFEDVPFVMYADDFRRIPELVDAALKVDTFETPDWNMRYFDTLPGLIAYD